MFKEEVFYTYDYMNNELISVIIPVYNVEIYLEKCINSIIDQSYSNIEIILIDDGSNDSSGIICDKFEKQDNRIKVFHKKNEGQAIARNIGISKAKGKYLIFIDSDDYIEKDMIEVLYNNLVNTESDIVCCGRIVEENGQTKLVNNKGNFFVNSEQGILRLINQDQIDSSPCDKIFKKSLFKNLKFPEGIVYEDLGLIYKLFDKCNKIYHIENVFYHYNIHSNSTMTSNISKFNKKNLDELKVKKEMREFISKKYPNLKDNIDALYYSTLIDIIIGCYEVKYDENLYNKLRCELLSNEKQIKNNKNIGKLSKIKFRFIKKNKLKFYIRIKKIIKHK